MMPLLTSVYDLEQVRDYELLVVVGIRIIQFQIYTMKIFITKNRKKSWAPFTSLRVDSESN